MVENLDLGRGAVLAMVIHNLSNPEKPRIVSEWRPEPSVGPQIAVHTVDIARLSEGFVITNPEAIMPQCQETQVPISIVDVSNLEKPKLVSNSAAPTTSRRGTL